MHRNLRCGDGQRQSIFERHVLRLVRLPLALAIGGALIATSSAQDPAKSASLLVGKWGPVNAPGSCSSDYMLYTANTITIVGNGTEVTGSYTFDGTTLSVRWNPNSVKNAPKGGSTSTVSVVFDGPNAMQQGKGRFNRCGT
jgi:hypothetical protein